MSIIRYQQASCAGHLRDQLELAGCEKEIAAIVSCAVGELIDHLADVEYNMKREVNEREYQSTSRESGMANAQRDLFERCVGITLFVMAVALVSASCSPYCAERPTRYVPQNLAGSIRLGTQSSPLKLLWASVSRWPARLPSG